MMWKVMYDICLNRIKTSHSTSIRALSQTENKAAVNFTWTIVLTTSCIYLLMNLKIVVFESGHLVGHPEMNPSTCSSPTYSHTFDF